MNTIQRLIKPRQFWIVLVVAHIIIAIPNATVTKVVVESADPLFWVLTRSTLLVVFVLPFVWRHLAKLLQRKTFALMTVSAGSMAAAIILSVYAIAYSQASYVSIITLATPIAIMVLSMIVFGERLTRRTATGVTLAALGAMTLVILPIALAGQSFAFYPLATVFALANIASFAVAIVTMRKLDQQAKVPLTLTIWYSAVITMIVSAALFMLWGDTSMMPIDSVEYWLAGLYASILLAFVGRMIMIRLLERVGPALFSATGYLETFGAILFPVIVIGERISITMALGGVLILLGVYIIEHHKHSHHRHYFLHRHH